MALFLRARPRLSLSALVMHVAARRLPGGGWLFFSWQRDTVEQCRGWTEVLGSDQQLRDAAAAMAGATFHGPMMQAGAGSLG